MHLVNVMLRLISYYLSILHILHMYLKFTQLTFLHFLHLLLLFQNVTKLELEI